jgi:hypothetical protein
MTRTIRLFVLLDAASSVMACLAHSGVLITGIVIDVAG